MTDTPSRPNPFESPVAPAGPTIPEAEAQLDAALGEELAEELAVEFRRTRPWVWLVTAIGFFVAGGCVVLGAVVVSDEGFGGRFDLLTPLVWIGSLGALFLAATLIARRFATRIRRYLRRPDFDTLEAALGANVAFWRFWGVLILIGGGVFGLTCVVALAMIAMNVLNSP